MKNMDKKMAAMVKSAGGKTMRASGVSDPRFARVMSEEMFPKTHKSPKPTFKDGPNPDKDVKPLKKMKGVEKGKGKEKK